jgi:co-chaperonin GroES (HSP10)
MRQPALSNAIKNDEWIDVMDDAVTLDNLPEIPGFHILVRPFSVKEKTKSGIFIPDSIKDDISYLTTVGQVIVVGDLAYEDLNKFPKGPWCEEGDFVCYGKHTGQKLFYQGQRFILLFDDQILMKVASPTHLDPTFNLSH